MEKKTLIVSIIAAILVLAIGWWLASPLFIDKVVDESLPTTNNQGENTPEPEAIVELQGSFVDADSVHKTSGIAKVVTIENQEYLSLEDFQTTNGPDLFVYLATDNQANEFVDLGALKGNIGNQNYQIPKGTKLEDYDKVLIWCRAFGVLFGSADLN